MMLLLVVVYFILCHHFIAVCPTRAFKGQENKTHLSFLSYDATLNAGHPSKCLSGIPPHPPNGVWRRASHRCHFLSAVYFPARAPVRLSGHPQSRPALCPPGGVGSDPTNPHSSVSPLQHSSQSQPLKLWLPVFTQPEHTPCNMLFHFLFIPCIFLAAEPDGCSLHCSTSLIT